MGTQKANDFRVALCGEGRGLRWDCDGCRFCMPKCCYVSLTVITSVVGVSLQAYDVVALKVKGSTAKTNFDISRYLLLSSVFVYFAFPQCTIPTTGYQPRSNR